MAWLLIVLTLVTLVALPATLSAVAIRPSQTTVRAAWLTLVAVAVVVVVLILIDVLA